MIELRPLSDNPPDVKIYPYAIISNPSQVFVGRGVVIDDFVLIVAREPIYLGDGVHIATGTSILGGESLYIGSWTSVSAGVRIFTATEGLGGLFGPSAPESLRLVTRLPVHIGRHCLIGANSVIMPGAFIPDGVVIGALSFLSGKAVLLPWSVYVGAPVRFLKLRSKQPIEAAEHVLWKLRGLDETD